MGSKQQLVFLRGILRGEGRQRECRIKATKHSITVDELSDPVSTAYSGLDIVDADDYPEGNYEVEFDGKKELLTKKDGHYLARR